MILQNGSKRIEIARNLQKAESFVSRLKGLLGQSSLAQDQALWIDDCPSIHTFFMKFAIDVVFVDSKLRVKAIYENVKPWRMIWPVWGAQSVIEFAVGAIDRGQIEVGDQFIVNH